MLKEEGEDEEEPGEFVHSQFGVLHLHFLILLRLVVSQHHDRRYQQECWGREAK